MGEIGLVLYNYTHLRFRLRLFGEWLFGVQHPEHRPAFGGLLVPRWNIVLLIAQNIVDVFLIPKNCKLHLSSFRSVTASYNNDSRYYYKMSRILTATFVSMALVGCCQALKVVIRERTIFDVINNNIFYRV